MSDPIFGLLGALLGGSSPKPKRHDPFQSMWDRQFAASRQQSLANPQAVDQCRQMLNSPQYALLLQQSAGLGASLSQLQAYGAAQSLPSMPREKTPDEIAKIEAERELAEFLGVPVVNLYEFNLKELEEEEAP